MIPVTTMDDPIFIFESLMDVCRYNTQLVRLTLRVDHKAADKH